MFLARVAGVVLATTLLLSAPAHAAYRLVDLGPVGDFSPNAIGEDATVVGSTQNNALPPMVWRDGTFFPLPGGGGRCAAYDINADGIIGGSCSGLSIYGARPALWTLPRGGVISGPQLLPGLDDEGSGEVTSVASDGSAAGYIMQRPVPKDGTSNPHERAVLWSPKGAAIRALDGPAFADSEYAFVTGHNSTGLVVGSQRGALPRRWTVNGAGVTRDATDPFSQTVGSFTPHPVNDAGIIAGTRRSDGTGLIRLNDDAHTLVSTANFIPVSINQRGETVGSRGTQAAIRKLDGTVVELASLLPTPPAMTLERASDLNERGDVIGTGRVGGIVHGFVLLNEQRKLLDVSLDAGDIGDNDIFNLSLTLRHTGEAGTPEIRSLDLGGGTGVTQNDAVFGAGNAPLLIGLFGPQPAYPTTLAPLVTTQHTLAYAVDAPGTTLLKVTATGTDAAGDPQQDTAGVKVEATYKTPTRQDLDGLVVGGLVTLMDQAVTRRDELAAKLSAAVRRRLKGSLRTPTPFERQLAAQLGLPPDALSWLPNRTTAVGSGSRRQPSQSEVAWSLVQATGSEMKKVGGEAVDRTLITPFVFWRDYLFEPGQGDRARVNLEIAGLLKDGYEGTTGVFAEDAKFYSSPAQMQAAWTALPQMTAEASAGLKQLDIATSNAVVQWDDLMRTDPIRGAAQFGKLLGRIEGEVAVGWMENFTGGKINEGLKTFAAARKAAGVKSDVSEVVGTTARLTGKGAAPVEKAKTLGNLSQAQVSRFQQIVKTINAKFGVDVELQARPINEFAAKVKGGIGKIEAVPTKNLTPDDVLLGAPQEYLGQTAYYRPKLPANFKKLTKDVQERLTLRVAEKGKELDQFLGKVPDPTGKAAKVRGALEKGGKEFTLGKNGKVVMELEQTAHASGAILIRYKKLVVNGKPVFTGAARAIVSDVDMNAVIDRVTRKALPAGIRGQVELSVMREFAKASEEGVFPFGYHGWTHSGFDVGATDFRYILKYLLMYLSDEDAARIAAKYAKLYGTTPQEFLDGYTKGKFLVKITAAGAELGLGG